MTLENLSMFKQNKPIRGGMMIQKKGQAAMEFLMTYGWALLVVLIAIGALAFFGVLNPSRFLPNSCSLAPGFACNDFKVSEAGNGQIIVVIQNGLGDNLNSVTLKLSNANPDCGGSATSAGVGFTPSSTTLNDGQSVQFTLNCLSTDVGIVKGTKLKGDIQIDYTVGSGANALPHKKVGQLVVGIEA